MISAGRYTTLQNGKNLRIVNLSPALARQNICQCDPLETIFCGRRCSDVKHCSTSSSQHPPAADKRSTGGKNVNNKLGESLAATTPLSRSFGSRVSALGRCSSSLAATPAAEEVYHPIVYHPDFQISPLPDNHRFPMPKDHLLYIRLKELGWATDANTFAPSYPDEDTLTLCHDAEFVRAFLDGSISESEMRRVNLPWSSQLRQRTLIGTGSAITAAGLALQWGVACMCNGGTHHAHRSHGSGWCVFNDQAVAARVVQRDAGVSQVLFIDLDVHHGDGTAAIFGDDDSVFTFSMHCDDQPFPAFRPPSDLDIGLPADARDSEYMSHLSTAVPRLLDELQPDIVFYNAGVDPHTDDALGLLALTDEGIRSRDALVISACAERRIPIAVAIGGGYSPDHASIVERHLSVHSAARDALAMHGPWGRIKVRPRTQAGPT